MKEVVCQTVNHSVNYAGNQAIDQSYGQSFSQSSKQSIRQPLKKEAYGLSSKVRSVGWLVGYPFQLEKWLKAFFTSPPSNKTRCFSADC